MFNRFDIASMLQASKSPLSDTASRRSGLLAGLPLVAVWASLCLIGISLCTKQVDSVYALSLTHHVSVKEYAAQKIQSKDQWVCLSRLYGKESGWNHKAVGNLNGSALVYGIAQIKNPLMLQKNEYEQIDYGLKYIEHRYGTDKYGYTNACKALKHFNTKGWH
jgi:hypothetical protein